MVRQSTETKNNKIIKYFEISNNDYDFKEWRKIREELKSQGFKIVNVGAFGLSYCTCTMEK